LEPVLIVGGPETGRRNDYIQQVRQRCVKEWGEQPEDHRFYAHETAVPQLLDILMTGSLFASGRFIQYLGADQVKTRDDARSLAAYARKPAENTVLILVSDGYGVDKLIEDAVPKDSRKIFWELSSSEMAGWINNYFASEGLSASQDAIEALLELVQANTEALKTECSRLALFYPKGSRLSEDDIERYVAHNRVEDAFSLFDRMATGSFEQALEVLAAIMAGKDGNGVGLLGGLLWSFRRLSDLHEAIARGTSYEAAARSLRITRRSALAVHDAALKRWPRELCRRLISFGTETDAQLRSMGQARERVILELFIYACMVAKAPLAFKTEDERP
jgi:DNA polymerase-3 subunit delta